jgi:peptidoglycan hydrolase CwlO-like protein
VTNPASDDELLDAVTNLSRLSDRQLLERLVRTTERLEVRQMADSDYINAALASLDTQLSDLGIRLGNQADELKRLADEETDYESLKAAVNAAADRVQADAVAVANMAQPTQVADPSTPVEATPVPTDPATPIDPSVPAQSDPSLPGAS